MISVPYSKQTFETKYVVFNKKYILNRTVCHIIWLMHTSMVLCLWDNFSRYWIELHTCALWIPKLLSVIYCRVGQNYLHQHTLSDQEIRQWNRCAILFIVFLQNGRGLLLSWLLCGRSWLLHGSTIPKGMKLSYCTLRRFVLIHITILADWWII